MERVSESDRQAAVLAALHTPLPAGALLDETQPCWPHLQTAGLKTDAAGLRAYQINAQATAQRVLASTFPTIAAMLGAETLDTLALLLWQHTPPTCGDLGEWGGALPDLLATHPDLKAWPWLADSARLDWARHACERAPNAILDADSLHVLGQAAPEHIRLWLKPCVQVLASTWPVARLWDVHQLPADQQDHAYTQALSPSQGGAVVVWRNPWQMQMLDLTGAQADWMVRLATSTVPASLAQLLHQASPALDFTDWLSQALGQGWLWRVTASCEDAPTHDAKGD